MKKIINRRTFMSRQGRHDEAVAHVTSAFKQGAFKHGFKKFRVMSSWYGTFNEIVLETEFDSIVQMQTVWDALSASPEAAEFMPKWYELTEAGGRNEVLVVEGSN